jgi:lactoylglutathione lyase
VSAQAVGANVKQAVPFLGVKDIQASLRFYIDGLGATMKHQWVPEGKLRWCWLQIDEAAIMLQEFWQEGSHANVPTEKVGVGVTICFQCRDAIALYQEFRARGLQPQRPFVGNQMWVTNVTDPDGYRLSFESPTDALEESEYQEPAK